MRNEFKIKTCSKENIQSVVLGFNKYNLSKVPTQSDTWTPLEFMITNQERLVIEGIFGGIGYWNGLEIKISWVYHRYSKSGLGSALLSDAEKIAYEKGATIIMLDTFDFQAPDFYLRNGYSVIGKIEDFPLGYKRLFFTKSLN